MYFTKEKRKNISIKQDVKHNKGYNIDMFFTFVFYHIYIDSRLEECHYSTDCDHRYPHNLYIRQCRSSLE